MIFINERWRVSDNKAVFRPGEALRVDAAAHSLHSPGRLRYMGHGFLEIRSLKNGDSGPWRVGGHVARFIKQEDAEEHLDSAHELSWKRESRYAIGCRLHRSAGVQLHTKPPCPSSCP
jgi:hypothetical protein